MNVVALALIIYLSAGFGVAVTITNIVRKMSKDDEKDVRVMILMFFAIMLFWLFILGNPIGVKHDND